MSKTLFWLFVCFSYLWGGVVVNSGDVFDAIVIFALAGFLHFNSDKLLSKDI